MLAEYLRRGTLAGALAVAQGGDLAMAQLFATVWIESGLAAGRQISDFLASPINPASRAFLERMGARRVTRVSRVTRQAIRDSIRIGQQAGLTQRAIATGQR